MGPGLFSKETCSEDLRNQTDFSVNDSINYRKKPSIFITNFSFLDAASIVAISESVIVDQGDEATLSCTADGNPLTDDTITWKRDNMEDFEVRTTVTYDKNGTSYLKINDVTREDLGNFQCVADNGVGNSSTRDVMLIVKRKFLFALAVISILGFFA